MDLSEFEHIFGASESAFVIWDTDNNGLIDSLELFSGITLFSDTKLEDKIRFLFDLFDFNELDSLALVDIEFMIYCCISATYKIYSISQEIYAEEIAAFVNKNFSIDVRINVVKLLQNSKQCQEIQEFFSIIKMENPNNGMKKFVTA
ncbi:hypothetical protein IMG5_187420 [Ichthyophthirius multifiliis]|uniref:EF-hand domain-containing protein n=1 Tax=Ichthyophthirius multifiliis TaxID=5932 RepID=G0R3T1_ICHMU|nr:hypothetical protein IMG5_187420 [Ichthyophthirius multifiliis]EGR27898.1 hypothetical protein IMG5_187420 [Ichthyophthirius multifiliis]|eukprot:XP_004027243.1 hypothetical protein IMG5_187420 [Ichthyophthirius multifiliis]